MTGSVSRTSPRLAPADGLAVPKAQLVAALAETLKERGLTQVQAARACGTDQPTLSKVLSGRSDRVTVDKLMRWLAALGRPVALAVAAPPDSDGHGRDCAWAGAAVDIDARKAAEEALRESEERYRLVTEAFHGGVSDYDLASGTVARTRRQLEIIGETAESLADVREAWYERIHPDDRRFYDEARTALFEEGADAREAEYRIRHRDGHWVWVWHRAIATRGADGRPRRIVGSIIDVTERKRAEEQRELLIHELNHRVKNTLATVQSLAAQTIRSAGSLKEFTAAFEARLFALSKTHNLLTDGAWAGASLRALLEVEVEPYAQGGEAGRFSLAGLHDVHLGARAAVALGLAFHELATNAVKYGALSNEAGRIEVMWTLENASEEQQLLLHLVWTEHGGPAVETPRRRGFGTKLIERGIRAELGGEVTVEHRPEGLRCEMRVPLDMPTMVFGQGV
jgi:PAS domain S-box-containing protein